MKSVVALSKLGSYNLRDVKEALNNIFTLSGGIESLKAKGNRVLLKPNMLMGAHPDEAVTTHPAVFEAAASLFLDHGFIVSAGDSPAVESVYSVAEKCGIAQAARRLGVPILDFKDTVSIEAPQGKITRKFNIAKAVVENDVIVSIAKLKTHQQMYYTGAIKNIFGVISGLEKSKFHFRFVERKYFAGMIVDLHDIVAPSFAIMDAVVSMEGDGPRNGSPVSTNFIGASFDPLALDCVCSEIIGYKSDDIPILYEAKKRRESFEIEIAGDDAVSLKPSSFKLVEKVTDIAFLRKILNRRIYNLVRNVFIPAPSIGKKCVLCMKCFSICSPQAISVSQSKEGRHLKVDLSKCIRCYCCHEVCAFDAMTIKRHLKF
ncbi:MAG TPA: DUF362 domain-containing protein [Spirochaetota bacterium]|nr:DUF362 domain-containing protein [Spirochaetota bacterium]